MEQRRLRVPGFFFRCRANKKPQNAHQNAVRAEKSRLEAGGRQIRQVAQPIRGAPQLTWRLRIAASQLRPDQLLLLLLLLRGARLAHAPILLGVLRKLLTLLTSAPVSHSGATFQKWLLSKLLPYFQGISFQKKGAICASVFSNSKQISKQKSENWNFRFLLFSSTMRL